MKDLYELLNDVEIDENDVEEMEVNEFERSAVKNYLKKSIKQKKNHVGWKKGAAAAAIISLSVVSFGLTFPAYAANIPIVGDIFRFLDGGRTGIYDQYKEYSTEVNKSKESNGIKVTLNDAIFDGKTVSITYSIESEHDLGDEHGLEKEPFVNPFLIIKGEQGWTVSSKLTKVDQNHYVGITIASINKFIEKKSVETELMIPSIKTKSNEILKGNWNFNLDLKATKNNVQVIEQSSEQNGVIVEVGKITYTPMSFIVYFNQTASSKVSSQFRGMETDIQIKDDLGNDYHGEIIGGWSDEEKGVSFGYSKTFEKIDANATKLIITPNVRLYEDMNKDGSVIGEQNYKLENIVVDLKE